MHCKPRRLIVGMVCNFREPVLKLGLLATSVFENFYRRIGQTQKLNMTDLQSFGGTSYADLKLSIRTFGGEGRVDVTPTALIVEVNDVVRTRESVNAIKEHLQVCEASLQSAIPDVQLAERLLRTNLWLDSDGGADSVNKFMAARGNAALKLDQGPYAALKKDYTLQFEGLDLEKATRIGLTMQRSYVDVGDLYLQFDHSITGSPELQQSSDDHIVKAEEELKALLDHLGLEFEDH